MLLYVVLIMHVGLMFGSDLEMSSTAYKSVASQALQAGPATQSMDFYKYTIQHPVYIRTGCASETDDPNAECAEEPIIPFRILGVHKVEEKDITLIMKHRLLGNYYKRVFNLHTGFKRTEAIKETRYNDPEFTYADSGTYNGMAITWDNAANILIIQTNHEPTTSDKCKKALNNCLKCICCCCDCCCCCY